jgi:hypothetical protein
MLVPWQLHNQPQTWHRLNIIKRGDSKLAVLHSLQGAKIVNSSHFELDYMLGRKITFFCMAQGQPRPHITWFKEGIELYAHQFFQASNVNNKSMFFYRTTQIIAHICYAHGNYFCIIIRCLNLF